LKLFRTRGRSQTVTGLHLAPQAMAAVTIERQRGRKPRLLDASAHDIDGGTSPHRQLRSTLGDARSPINLVMPEHQYELLLVEAPRVEPSELRAAVRWKVRNLIDFHIDDAVIDVFEIPGQRNRPQGQAMMYVVAARARDVREHIDLVEEADGRLEVIDITEMAMRNLAGQLEEDVRGVAMLYLDESHGIITITHQGSLYLSRRVEMGTSQLAQDADSAAAQLALEVQRSLDYYDSHFDQPPVAALRVLPGLEGLDVVIGALREGLPFDVATLSVEELVSAQCEIPGGRPAELLIALGGALRQEEVSL